MTKLSDVTLRFRVDDGAAADKDAPKHALFQTKISYTTSDGAQWMRVYVAKRACSSKRAAVEKNVDVSVVGAAALRRAVARAHELDFAGARDELLQAQRLFDRAAQSDAQQEVCAPLTHPWC